MSYKFGSEPCAKERFYQLQPVPDPVVVAAVQRRPHRNAATGRTLFHQSVMPVGLHLGKIMERVPADYFLYIRKTQPWMKGHHLWGNVWDYIDVNLSEIEVRCARENAERSNPAPKI